MKAVRGNVALTVIGMAIAIAIAISSQVAMAKSTIGGIVFTNLYTFDVDETSAVNIDSDEKGTELEVPNNSRLRIRWDNEDNVGMYIEMGIGGSVKLRHAYGKWDVDEKHQLLAGRTSTPFAPLNPSVAMVNNTGEGYGSVSPGRRDQIRYTYKFLNRQGALAVALVDPGVKNTPVGATNETVLPRLDVGMAYRTFNWQLFPSFFLHKQEFDGADDITAYGYSLGAKTAAGPIVFTAELGAGQNWGNTQMSIGSSGKSFAGDNSAGTADEDNDNISYWFDLGYRFTTEELKGTVHLVYGRSESELDNVSDVNSTLVGLSIPIDMPWIARGFRLRPEIFHFKDESDTNFAERDETIVGVQLQFTF